MKNEKSGTRGSHSSEKRDSNGRFESNSNSRGSHSSSSSSHGNSGQKRDSEGRFTSESHRGRKSEK